MTFLVTVFIMIVLSATAALHFYWAAGGLWPGRDEKSLARTVVGVNGINRMPARVVTFAVALCILLAAVWPALWLGWIATGLPDWLLGLGMGVLFVVFAVRGAAGFVPAVRRMNGEQPFARLDSRYFSPLILTLALAFGWLLVSGAGRA